MARTLDQSPGAVGRRAYQARWIRKNPEKYQAYLARNRKGYWEAMGMTKGLYEKLLKFQGGGCRICGGTNNKKVLAIDHCHSTGRIRGLLCMKCNCAIGLCNDDPVRLRRAAVYLESNVWDEMNA